MTIYTNENLDEALGKLAMAQARHAGVLLTERDVQVLVTEVCALRQACECYDGSKMVKLGTAVEAREQTNHRIEP